MIEKTRTNTEKLTAEIAENAEFYGLKVERFNGWTEKQKNSHEKAQNAQKGQKTGQKVLYKHINSAVERIHYQLKYGKCEVDLLNDSTCASCVTYQANQMFLSRVHFIKNCTKERF